jgi:hypothetical protein
VCLQGAVVSASQAGFSAEVRPDTGPRTTQTVRSDATATGEAILPGLFDVRQMRPVLSTASKPIPTLSTVLWRRLSDVPSESELAALAQLMSAPSNYGNLEEHPS